MSASTSATPLAQPLSLDTVCKVIQQLSECSLERWNGPSSDLAVSRLLATNKPIDELTVGEVREIIKQAGADYNAAYRAEHSIR